LIYYIQKAGLLMWPILACSIIAIAAFAERFFYLHRATIHVGEFLKGLSNLANAGISPKRYTNRPAPPARSRALFILRFFDTTCPDRSCVKLCRKRGSWRFRSSNAFLAFWRRWLFSRPYLACSEPFPE